tara:strand:+ start:7027 stop:7659 length:633 start_codon:yes stop_codon:yes gene_type:complete
MRGWIIIGLLAIGTSAFRLWAVDPADSGALAALDSFAQLSGQTENEPVLGMVGFFGQPQPPQWLILTDVINQSGVMRESVVAGGTIVAERKFQRLPNQDMPDIPIDLASLKVDSGAVFKIVEKLAASRKVSFDSVHFQLRSRDLKNEAVWMLNLNNVGQVSVGILYVSAVSGELLRANWSNDPVDKYSSADLPSKGAPTASRSVRNANGQ